MDEFVNISRWGKEQNERKESNLNKISKLNGWMVRLFINLKYREYVITIFYTFT